MDASFALLAAIDLHERHVVRLRGGDFGRETAYSDDPAAIARSFVAAGVPWLHLVDLDGARAGEPVQLKTIREVIDAAGGRAHVEVAGGLRSAAAIDAAFAAGAARVVVGTAAIRDPAFAAKLVDARGPSAVAVALDVRDGLAIGDGWQRGAPGEDVGAVIQALAAAGVRSFEVTAIERDGSLEGPDLGLLRRLVALGAGDVIASGGIASVDDLRAVRAIGCVGAIVGRAIYEGTIHLDAALDAVGGRDTGPGLEGRHR